MKATAHIRAEDQVMVIAGKDKGKTGKVAKVHLDTGKVTIEGINRVKRHMKASQQNPQGGIVEKSLAIAISNVLPLDPKTQKPTRVGRKWMDAKKKGGKGRWVRYAKGSGEIFPIDLQTKPIAKDKKKKKKEK